MKTLHWITITLLLISIILISAEKRLILDNADPTIDLNSSQEGVLEQPGPLDEWIETLGSMENCAPEGTWDSGSYSYGRWCYKEPTFKYFVRRYDLLPHVEDVELMNWIGDETFQRSLTRMVFEDSYKNTSHWHTSVYKRDLGEPPRI